MATDKANAPAAALRNRRAWMAVYRLSSRIIGGIDPLMHKYNASISYDKLLYKEDILGSIAFTRANAKSGIISNDEFVEIERGLREVLKEWDADTFTIMPNDEDIHTANERRLGEIISKDIAGKLHTGRSRNEQVIDKEMVAFLQVIIARAEAEIYTHLQRAMAVRFSAWLLSFGFAFASDLERLRETFKRVNKSPLGCGALAGNAFNIDRDMMAKELGFDGILWSSMGAVSSRDFVTEFLQWGSMFMGHISNWGQDLIELKKNPDGLELLRGKSGRCFGQLAGFMMTSKSLTSTYNKDLQESWEPMLDHVKTISDSIQIANGILSTLTIRPERMLAALDPTLLATDLADFLVRKGVPFRETHHISGRVVAKSEELGIPMDSLSLEQLKAIDNRFTDDVMDIFNYETSVESRSAKGGTSRSSILEQIKVLKAILS
ncbi:argininosuccinate lyase [Xylariaceae sp. FL0255]|nr:argininosuccinate lyase [Xylariaceae sp. FL0255]